MSDTIYFNEDDENKVEFFTSERLILDFNQGIILPPQDEVEIGKLTSEDLNSHMCRISFHRPDGVTSEDFTAWITAEFLGYTIIHGMNGETAVSSTIHDVSFVFAALMFIQGLNRIDNRDIRMDVHLELNPEVSE